MIDEKDVDAIYCYIYEYAKMTYDYELRRSDSIIQQASHMQTAFSFITAALFMVASLRLETVTPLCGWFYFSAYSTIVIILLLSLFAATMAQNRRRGLVFENAESFRRNIEDDYSNFVSEAQRKQYLAKYYEKIQKDQAERNKKAVEWIQLSMYLFYTALFFIALFFVSALFMIGEYIP